MADFPVINGRHFSFQDAEIKLDGVTYTGITTINFSEGLEPGKVHGTGVYPIGDTVGEYTADADMEMHIQAANAFREALKAKHPNGSYGLVKFDVLVYWSNGGDDPVHEAKLVGCRWKGAGNDNARSTDPSIEKIGLHVMWIERDGARMLAPADAGGR